MTSRQAKEFLQEVMEATHLAEKAAGGGLKYDLQIGGHVVRLKFYGESLAQAITTPFLHLTISTDHSEPELIIHIWDSASTGVKMPPRPWNEEDIIARGEIRGFGDERICVALSADVGAVSVCDVHNNVGIFWIRSADHLPLYEQGAPLRWILSWWMRQRKKYLVHAGLIGRMGQGVLLVGKGGSGKSTTALSCLAQGWDYLADDYCLVQLANPPMGYSVYSTAKLNHRYLRKFSDLWFVDRNPLSSEEEKALMYLPSQFAPRIRDRLPLRAILIPKVMDRIESKVIPTSTVVALKALAPSSLFQLPATGVSDFQSLAEIVKLLPAFILELGTAINKIPCAIEEVLK